VGDHFLILGRTVASFSRRIFALEDDAIVFLQNIRN